jgi:ATP-dependent DNA ligase
MAKSSRSSRPIKRATTNAKEQPELFDEPMPSFVEPCLATLRADVPAGERWVHEIKWDGYRLQIRVGLYDGKALTCVGRVGSGFNTKTAADLWKQLQPLRTDGPPFAQRLSSLARKGVVWVRPELVAEVAYRGWTSDGLVRHP